MFPGSRLMPSLNLQHFPPDVLIACSQLVVLFGKAVPWEGGGAWLVAAGFCGQAFDGAAWFAAFSASCSHWSTAHYSFHGVCLPHGLLYERLTSLCHQVSGTWLNRWLHWGFGSELSLT